MLTFYLLAISDDEDRQKFKEIYKQHRQMMFYAALKIVSSPTVAEDIVGEAFLRLIDNLQKINEVDGQKTRAYLVTIVKNIALNHLAKGKREVFFSQDDEDEEKYPDEKPLIEEQTEQKAEYAQLRAAILNLPQEQQEILQLYYMEERKVSEVARMLDISENAVYKRLDRARKNLKKEFGEREEY